MTILGRKKPGQMLACNHQDFKELKLLSNWLTTFSSELRSLADFSLNSFNYEQSPQNNSHTNRYKI